MILQGNNIHFSYGGETVFKGFNFSVDKGEKIVVKGESGGGKSTLLRLILGFEIPDSGELLYNGSPLEGNTLKEFRTQCSWLPQDLNIGQGPVEEVVRFPFTFRQRSRSFPGNNRVHDIFSDLGLEDQQILDKSYSDLSTGQRQRVGIALCILMDNPVLLLDEPTSALDESSKQKAADHFFSDNSKTIVSISHDPFWIERCTRIIDLDAKEKES